VSALPILERHCPNCRRLKPVEEFRSNRYCVTCKASYARHRYAEMKAGTWKPKAREEYAPPRPRITGAVPVEAVHVHPTAAPTTSAQETRLREALEAFMLEFGFTTLRVVYARLEGEVARKFRGTLARDGWIA
jgi:hypothetical protein